MRRALGIIALLAWLPLAAAEPDWQLRRDSEALRIYTRPVADSPIKAIKIETRFAARPEQVAALLNDSEQRQRWDELCRQAVWLDEERASLLYLYYDMPWPVSDRDVVLRTSTRRDEGGIVIRSDAVSSPAHTDSGAVRIERAWYQWTLQASGPDHTEVTAIMYMDPAGPIPSWLINSLSLTQPGNSIGKLKALLEK